MENKENMENMENMEMSTEVKTQSIEDKSSKKTLISKTKLLESGIQFGHQTKYWDPKMKPFIHNVKKGIHIINLHKTIASLQNAYTQAEKLSAKGGKFLFVGTSRKSKATVKLNAERSGSFYIDNRWMGGILTNWKTIQKSINRLRTLERLEKAEFAGYTKKEGVFLKRELDKLEVALGGIKYMRRLPNAIFVASVKEENIAIKEAQKLGIPVFGIVDTNVDPTGIQYPIAGNDDSNKATALVTTLIADAIVAAKGGQTLAAYQPEEKVQVLGVEAPTKIRTNEFLSQRNRNSFDRNSSTRSENRQRTSITNSERANKAKLTEKVSN